MDVHKLQTQRTVDLATALLRDQILGGAVTAGERLPPERSLAQSLGINRQTLRSALARLESEGLVKARQGSGVTVLDYRLTGGVALLPHLLRVGEPTLLQPFLTLRRAVASEAVAVACREATDTELDALGVLADSLSIEMDIDRLADGNLRFGRQVLRLANNLPMELLFNTVTEVYRLRPALRLALVERAEAVRASFPAIVALLRQRDPDLARTAVREVLEALDSTVELS